MNNLKSLFNEADRPKKKKKSIEQSNNIMKKLLSANYIHSIKKKKKIGRRKMHRKGRWQLLHGQGNIKENGHQCAPNRDLNVLQNVLSLNVSRMTP